MRPALPPRPRRGRPPVRAQGGMASGCGHAYCKSAWTRPAADSSAGIRRAVLCRLKSPPSRRLRRRLSSAGSPTGRVRHETSMPTSVPSRSSSAPRQPEITWAPEARSTALAPGRRDRGRLSAGLPHDGGGLRGAGARRPPLRQGPRPAVPAPSTDTAADTAADTARNSLETALRSGVEFRYVLVVDHHPKFTSALFNEYHDASARSSSSARPATRTPTPRLSGARARARARVCVGGCVWV